MTSMALLCRHTKWSTCTLSGQPLAAPIAADWLGRLYNAEVCIRLIVRHVGHYFALREGSLRMIASTRRL